MTTQKTTQIDEKGLRAAILFQQDVYMIGLCRNGFKTDEIKITKDNITLFVTQRTRDMQQRPQPNTFEFRMG